MLIAMRATMGDRRTVRVLMAGALAVGMMILCVAPSFADDDDDQGEDGWKHKHKHKHHHHYYAYPDYYYVPARPVVVVPQPVIIAPPPPIYVAPLPPPQITVVVPLHF
jgi:hypothetical protein